MRLWVVVGELDRLLECRFRLRGTASDRFNESELCVGSPALRVEANGLVNFTDGLVEILLAGQCVPAKHMGDHSTGVQLDGGVGSDQRIVRPAGCQQVFAGLQLDVDILCEKIGRANVLPERIRVVTDSLIGFCEPQARLAELRIDLHRIAEFDHRFLVLRLFDKFVAAIQVLLLSNLRISRATG